MKAYKGFDKNLQCRGFQYEVGGEYETDRAEVCVQGFHACENPLDVWRFYPPIAGNRFCEVELSGDVRSDGRKSAATRLKVGAEIGISKLVMAFKEWVRARIEGSEDKKSGGDGANLAGGDGANLAGGDGANLAGGDWANLAGGEWANLAGGDGANLAGGYSANLVCRGSSSVGNNGVAVVRGNGCKVRGGAGAVLVVVEEKASNCDIEAWRAVVVDGEKVKAGVWYSLRDGELVEVEP